MALTFRRPVTQALAGRALLLWAVVRAVIAVLLVAAGPAMGVADPGPVFVVLVASGLGMLDIRRRRERDLWANLGTSPLILWVTFASVAAIGEGALWVVRTLIPFL